MINIQHADTPVQATKPQVQWGHVAFVMATLIFVLWFLQDAWRASDRFENLMLIVPVAVLVVATCVAILGSVALRHRQGLRGEELPPVDLRIPAFMLLVAGYVVGMLFTGFDLATFLFMISCLWLLGERNYLLGVAYSAIITAIAVFGLREMISLPIPTILFPA